MSKKIILDKDKLYQLYCIEKLPQKKVAEYFNCSIDTIKRNLTDYQFPIHSNGSWSQSNIVKLTNKQQNVLEGALLGDGCLIKHKFGKNAQFAYTSKSKQHVEFVCNDFLKYSYAEGIKKINTYDKRTDKTYTRYTFRSITDKGFTPEYERWYIDNIKHLPNDLKLNSLNCLIWYIGDGSICNSSKNTSQTIKLSTHCFSKEEQEDILIPQLSLFNPKLHIADRTKNTKEPRYVIYIPKNKMELFLEYIGDCPFEDYEYKWKIKESLKPSYQSFHKEWEQLYLNGMSYIKIAKKFGADNTTVLKFLQRKGIYQPKI